MNGTLVSNAASAKQTAYVANGIFLDRQGNYVHEIPETYSHQPNVDYTRLGLDLDSFETITIEEGFERKKVCIGGISDHYDGNGNKQYYVTSPYTEIEMIFWAKTTAIYWLELQHNLK